MALMLALGLLLPLISRSEAAPSAGIIPGSRAVGLENSYWETPMDIRDEAAVWAMLTAPITIVDGHQKQQMQLLSEPRQGADPVADLTYDSQGLHVLETLDNGWSLVECYSSSFHDSKVKAWNQLVQGYIKTSLLKTVAVDTRYAMVADKLDQRLYIFEDGKLYDTLLISTGLANDSQPYNETRSGEFLIVSPVGDFRSDNMIGAMALRFNDGDFIHETPYILRGDTRVFDYTEPLLGQRASHGCIRVQRKRTPKGTNQRWIWDTFRKHLGARLVIWEDLPGRQLPLPDAATPLYYNTQGGRDYHAGPTCYGVKDKFYPLASFTYGELENAPYSSLNACAYCVPPRRVMEIEAINQAHRLP
ncbi:MAG: L,D-transpeptidase [Christensenellales bacterium]